MTFLQTDFGIADSRRWQSGCPKAVIATTKQTHIHPVQINPFRMCWFLIKLEPCHPLFVYLSDWPHWCYRRLSERILFKVCGVVASRNWSQYPLLDSANRRIIEWREGRRLKIILTSSMVWSSIILRNMNGVENKDRTPQLALDFSYSLKMTL